MNEIPRDHLSNHAADQFAKLTGHVFIELDRSGQIQKISSNHERDLTDHLGKVPLASALSALIEEDATFSWPSRLEKALNESAPQEFSILFKHASKSAVSFHCKLHFCNEHEHFFVALQKLPEHETNLPLVLQKTLNHLNLSLKTANLGLWEVLLKPGSEEMEQVNWDTEMSRIHGVPAGTSVDRQEWFFNHIHPEDLKSLEANYGQNAKKSESDIFHLRYRVIWPNNEVHFIEMHGTRSASETASAGSKLYGVAKDVTQEVMERKFLEDQKNRILANSRMTVLGEISGGIAHEINNPLTVIQARSFQLIQMLEQNNLDAAKVRAAAESISKTGDKIAKIIKSIRAFAQSHENSPFDLVSVKDLIDETLDFCKVRFYNHGIDIKVKEVPENLEIECRVVQIEEVLLNIFNNAHDAIQKLPEKWIEVETFDVDDSVEIHITDSGHGIQERVADQMMLPFYTTKESGKGTGLGLSISAEIVQSHHGAMTLDRSSKNTRFVLRFPKMQPEEAVL